MHEAFPFRSLRYAVKYKLGRGRVGGQSRSLSPLLGLPGTIPGGTAVAVILSVHSASGLGVRLGLHQAVPTTIPVRRICHGLHVVELSTACFASFQTINLPFGNQCAEGFGPGASAGYCLVDPLSLRGGVRPAVYSFESVLSITFDRIGHR